MVRRRLPLILGLCLLVGAGWPSGVGWAEEATAPPVPAVPAAAPLGPAQAGTTPPAAPTQTQAANSPVENVVGLFLGVTTEQYDRLAALVEEKYPDLTQELVKFLFAEQPDLLSGLMSGLAPRLSHDYPEIPKIIMQMVRADDRLQVRVSQLVTEEYPGFLADLAKIRHGSDRKAEAAQLLNDKYPDLYAALIDLLRVEFPETLNQIRDKVLACYPGIMADLARLTAKTFPRLTAKALNFVVHRYPQLLPQIIAVLYGSDSRAPAAGGSPGPAAAEVTPPDVIPEGAPLTPPAAAPSTPAESPAVAAAEPAPAPPPAP